MYTIENKTLTDIADAIREKTGKSGLIKPEDMAGEIEGIKPNLQSKTATANGTVTADSGYDGLSNVIVDIPAVGQNPEEFGETGITDSGLGWSCYTEYYVEDQGTILAEINRRTYTKHSNGACLVIKMLSNTSQLYNSCPLVLSTNIDNVAYGTNYDSVIHTGQYYGKYLGMDWYGCANYGHNNAVYSNNGIAYSLPTSITPSFSVINMTEEQKRHLLCTTLGMAGVHLTPKALSEESENV